MLNEEISKTIPSTADATDILGINDIKPYNDDNKAFEYVISPYFNLYKDKEAHNFSKRKLINILEDVQINNEEVYNIVKKVNLENLRTINEIPLGGNKNVTEEKTVSKDRVNQPWFCLVLFKFYISLDTYFLCKNRPRRLRVIISKK